VCKRKSECVRSSRIRSKSRRRWDCAGVGAGTPAARVAAWAAAAQRGGSRGGQRGVGEGGCEAGEGTWTGAERRWGCELLHMAGRSSAERRAEEQRREREVDESGPGCNFQKRQGPHCNALVTFKPEIKWKWTQKQKCRVYQNLQHCFKVHL
jgi:hypothetical protein